MHTCDYATGAVLDKVANDDVARRYGAHTLAVHRADLHDVLLDAVRADDPDSVYAADEFESLDQDDDGVSVRFANGGRTVARWTLARTASRRRCGRCCFRTRWRRSTARWRSVPWCPKRSSPPAYGAQTCDAPRPPAVPAPLSARGGLIMNLIGCGQTDVWEAEGWSIPATNDEFAAAYSDFAPELLELIHNVPEGELFKWGLRDRRPLERWTVGRVAMLGDAAHPMTPFLGQGACMAIEDALLLGLAFAASSSVLEALRRYEGARKPRGNSVQLLSLEEGRALQDPTRERKGARVMACSTTSDDGAGLVGTG